MFQVANVIIANVGLLMVTICRAG